MIRTEREYRGALQSLAEGQQFAEQQRAVLAQLTRTPEEVERGMEPLLTFQARLREEIAWYERARRGELDQMHLSQLGRLLIALRIASGLTQRQLAEKLGVSEAQVSRDERNEYHAIGLDRAQRILDALGVTATVGVQQRPGATFKSAIAGVS